MKINLISDLHLDLGPPLEGFDGGDTLLIAGDTCEARNIERFQSFFEEVAEKFRRVYVIAGNHEFYGGEVASTLLMLREFYAQFKNITFLENQVVIGFLDQMTVLFAGTFWTDFNQRDPASMQSAEIGLNDYYMIDNGDKLLTPADVLELHSIAKGDLYDCLNYFGPHLPNGNGGANVIVMTHHAPSHRSIPPRFMNDYRINGAFVNELDGLILAHPRIRVWVHGHTHTSLRYKIGDTQIHCNPRGYGSENLHFDKNYSFEV